MVWQEEIISAFETSSQQRLADEKVEVENKYDELIKNIQGEKKIKKLETDHAAWSQAIKEREAELKEARNAQLQMLDKTANNRSQYLSKVLRFFYIGRSLNYPVETYNEGNELVPAVFLGFMIDAKKKNPFAPSAIKCRFAISNSSKYIALPASYSEDLMATIGASADIVQPTMEELLDRWEEYTRQNNVDRRPRHIITGNLLQAFSDFKGKLVSYTTSNGETKKGILLPENWNPGEQVQDKVVVPIAKALPIVKSLVQNAHIITNNGISFFKSGDYFKIIVSASRAKGE